jgi:hypothetical protein
MSLWLIDARLSAAYSVEHDFYFQATEGDILVELKKNIFLFI